MPSFQGKGGDIGRRYTESFQAVGSYLFYIIPIAIV
jgi:hypothetical protein